MIQLPKKLHRLEFFEQDEKQYVADLDRECVLPISEIQAEILKWAETSTSPQIIDALKEEYEEHILFQAFEQLDQWAKLGFIFSRFPLKEPTSKNQPYRIFVMHDLLYPPLPKHPANALQNYQLVTALARRLSIDFAIPEEKQEEIKFEEKGIQTVPVKSGRVFSPLWYAAQGNYDAILAITPGYFEDLPFYCQSDLPVLARIYSEGWEKEAILNKILAKAALTRPYDALVVDASWVQRELSSLLSNALNVIYIPDGIDFQQFQPISSSQAKSAIAQGLEISHVNGPIVGLVLETNRDEKLRIVSRIAVRHPEWFILLYDETLLSRLPDFPENVRCFGAKQFDDPFLLPVVLNGLDVLFFYASVGAPARILTGAMACGTPLVTASRYPLLELDEDFPRIPLEKEQVWKEQIPWEEISRIIAELLANHEKRIELASRAKQHAARFTWDASIEHWNQLIERLKKAQNFECMQHRHRRPLLFCRWYDKGQETIQSQAVSFDNFSRQSIEDGLAHDLLCEHTLTEIALVMQKLRGTQEKVQPSRMLSSEDFTFPDSSLVDINEPVESRSHWEKRHEISCNGETYSMDDASTISEKRKLISLGEQVEGQLADKAKLYPHATGYLRKIAEKSLRASPFAAGSKLQGYFQRAEGFWQHFDDLVADILYVTGWSMEELFDQPAIELKEEQMSFEAIKERWYETPFYPVSEHLNYIEFEPALERARFILKHLNQLEWEQAHFLDLGFGPGILTSLILQTKTNWQGYGVDISLSCYNYARKLLTLKGIAENAHLLVGDVRQLPYPDESFDVVIGMEVFEHIPQPEEGLSEAVRVLKPGGYAITALPVKLPLKMHLHIFEDTQEILELYQDVGLKVLDFQEREYQLPQRKFIDTFALSTSTKT